MISIRQIKSYALKIAEEFSPNKIILFGSYANNRATVDSDVDLLVIMPFKGKGFRKSVEILNKTNPEFPIDLLARNPEDIEWRYQQGDPLIRDALDNGTVLYERDY